MSGRCEWCRQPADARVCRECVRDLVELRRKAVE